MIFQDFCHLDEMIFNTDPNVEVIQLIRMGLYDKCIEILEKKKRTNRKEQYFLAVCFQKTKQYRKALGQYVELSRLEPNNIYHILGKADCYFYLGEPSKALFFYKKMVSQLGIDHPKYVSVLKGAADIYFFTENFKVAELLYTQCIELNPKCYHSLSQKAYICFKKEQVKESFNLLRKSLAINPDYENSLLYLSLVYHFIGDTELSLGCIDRLLEINPYYEKGLKVFIQIQTQLTNYHKIIEKMLFYLNENPLKLDSDWIYYNLSKAYLLKGEAIKAKKHLNQIRLKSNFNDFLELHKAIQLCLSEVSS